MDSMESEFSEFLAANSLGSLTMPRLEKFAKEKNIKPEGRVKKAELISSIEEYFH